MSLGFDSISENPISALSAAGNAVTGTCTAGQGSQTANATALLQFIASATAGNASETATVTALLQFIANATAGQASETASATAQQIFSAAVAAGQASETAAASALLQFIASTTAGQAGETANALGATGNGIIGSCSSGQGIQTSDCVASLTGVSTFLDGAGVGRGNKSWWHDKEIVVDHRVKHKANVKVDQAEQTAEGVGGVRNPFTLVVVEGKQAAASAVASGDVTDPELEEFAMMAAAMLMDEWREAA